MTRRLKNAFVQLIFPITMEWSVSLAKIIKFGMKRTELVNHAPKIRPSYTMVNAIVNAQLIAHINWITNALQFVLHQIHSSGKMFAMLFVQMVHTVLHLQDSVFNVLKHKFGMSC